MNVRKEDNLIPFDSNQSREQAKKNGRKGGIASARAKKERKSMEESLNYLLSLAVKDGKIVPLSKLKNLDDAKGKNLCAGDIILIKQLAKAMNGELKSAIFIRDTIGEKPKEQVEVRADVKTADNLTYDEAMDLLKSRKKLE